jgi:pimeloyl-ACP methyl ester carboxylesterase
LSSLTPPSPPAKSTTGLRRDGLLQRILAPLLPDIAPPPPDVPELPPSKISRTLMGRRSYVEGGSGGPTVVFESGLGNGKEAWAHVFAAVSEHTHAIAYDRAGYGDSPASRRPRDGYQIVRELRAMLAHEKIPPPYVLVGHSLGGMIVKLFARSYPEEVAGVVLVDARHSEFAARCRQLGMSRVLYEPPPLLFMMQKAMHGELKAAAVTSSQARRAGPFPKVPLIVLTQRKDAVRWPGDLGKVWVAAQRNMKSMSALGRIKVASGSGHNVHKDRPDVVIRAVLSVVSAARYRQSKKAGTGKSKP